MLDLQSSHDVFQVAKKIRELMADSEHMDVLHESHDIFKREQDEQLVQWMNRSVCQKQEMVLCARDSFHCPCQMFLLMFAVGGQTTGLFRPVAVEPSMGGDITTGANSGALKVQK